MRIGELARRSGVSERSLRYYETQGLLASERTPGGQRRFGEWAVDRVIRVQALYAAGLNSKKIAQLLPCMRDTDGGPSELATPQLVDELSAERDRINHTIADLIRSRDVLDEVISTASSLLRSDLRLEPADAAEGRGLPAPAAAGGSDGSG
ncbi:MerR family transcriptional regulator [Streptomyces sp. NPDC093225]|uniref:MerR family transcriptional regulator n=1 Tax=Streptomyces sp. NPDC093225 TaxID=3366034 RepID=UPI003812E07F